jgi:hypothetical protein
VIVMAIGGFSVTGVLLLMALFRNYTAALEPERRAEAVRAKTQMYSGVRGTLLAAWDGKPDDGSGPSGSIFKSHGGYYQRPVETRNADGRDHLNAETARAHAASPISIRVLSNPR